MSERPQTPYELLGEEKVRALAEAFYTHMDAHEPALAKLHEQDADGKVAKAMRERFGLFLVGWFGGPQHYMERHGHPRLRMRHAHFQVDEAMRDAWLRSMHAAMDELAIDGEVRAFLDERFATVADFLRNVP
jgi:hemoglobin